jgi:hypothetical protein
LFSGPLWFFLSFFSRPSYQKTSFSSPFELGNVKARCVRAACSCLQDA